MPQQATVSLLCVQCAAPFLAQKRDALRGRAKFCGRSCMGRARAVRVNREHPQAGEGNFNFKGWASRRPSVYVRRFQSANPHVVAAHRVVARAVAAGLLVRPDRCSVCGRVCKPDAHHRDYSRPLDVVWVCRLDHVVLDRARQLEESTR